MRKYPEEENELMIAARTRKNIVVEGTRRVNWEKAKHGWTRYYDDGVVTLDPEVFFRVRKNHE